MSASARARASRKYRLRISLERGGYGPRTGTPMSGAERARRFRARRKLHAAHAVNDGASTSTGAAALGPMDRAREYDTHTSNMDEENQIDDKLKRKRELTNARVKKYRKKKRTESQQLNSSMQDGPTEEMQNKHVKENNAERKRALAKERSRRFRERKRLNVLKSLHHVVYDSQIPGPSHGNPPLVLRNQRTTIHDSQIAGTSTNMIKLQRNLHSNFGTQTTMPLKCEPCDEDIDIGPVVLQHMDRSWRTCEVDVAFIKQEGATTPEQSDSAPSVKEENAVDDCSTSAANNRQQQSVNSVNPMKQFKCDVCDKTYKSKNALYSHVRNDHGSRIFECSHCNYVSKLKCNLQRHMCTAHFEEKHECELCNKMFKAKYLLTIHQSNVDCSERYECSLCKRTFKRKGTLKEHMIVTHGNEQHECNVCKKLFKAKHLLLSHVNHSHSSKKYQCAECNSVFKRKWYLKQHMHFTHGHRHLDRAICHQILKSKSSARCHIKNVHEHNPNLQCKVCCKEYKTMKCLRNHEARGDCSRPSAVKSGVASTSTQQHNVLVVKEEPADGELDLGPVVFQHMDCNYRPYKEELQED